MHSRVAEAFDKGDVVLTPFDGSESPVLQWRIRMTYPAADSGNMGRGSLRYFDGKEGHFMNGRRPACKSLY